MASIREEAPLTGADLDRWTAGLDGVAAAAARVLAGVEAGALQAWLAATPALPGPAFLPWRLPPEALANDAAVWTGADDGRLGLLFNAETPARHQPPAMRLAVTGNLIPAEVVPRLLACPGVAAVVLPAQRAAGALRRRAWHWPLRIGVLEGELRDSFAALRGDEGVPPPLVDVSDLRTDPGGVDLVLFRGTPADAAAQLGERRQLAGAVVCVGEPSGAWPVVDAHLALVRAVTGAVAIALVPPDGAEGVVRHVLGTLRHLAHSHPLDVALTAGFDREILLTGELAALADSDLPTVVSRRARQLRLDFEELRARDVLGEWAEEGLIDLDDLGEEPERPGRDWRGGDYGGGKRGGTQHGGDRGLPGERPTSHRHPPRPQIPDWGVRRAQPALEELEALPDGAFDRELGEAFRVPEVVAEVDSILGAAASPRFLQAYVASVASPAGGAGTAEGVGPAGTAGHGDKHVATGAERRRCLHRPRGVGCARWSRVAGRGAVRRSDARAGPRDGGPGAAAAAGGAGAG